MYSHQCVLKLRFPMAPSARCPRLKRGSPMTQAMLRKAPTKAPVSERRAFNTFDNEI